MIILYHSNSMSYPGISELTLPASNITLNTPYFKSATSERLADRNGVPHAEYSRFYEKVASNSLISTIISGHIAVSRLARGESR